MKKPNKKKMYLIQLKGEKRRLRSLIVKIRQKYLPHRYIPSNEEIIEKWKLKGLIKIEFQMPLNLSIVNNPNECIEIFTKINFHINEKNDIHLFFDKVENITIDSLLYLLAYFNKQKFFKKSFRVQGNTPLNQKPKEIFQESGFYQYVNSKWINHSNVSNCVQICSGNKIDPNIPKKLCIFASKMLNYTRNETKGLYDLTTEIISNSTQHAFHENVGHLRWFAYANFNHEINNIEFSLLDTGEGIPDNVKKSFFEEVQKFISNNLSITTIDHKLIESALNGDFRTGTQKTYRGKGMPQIKKYFDSGYIKNLTIISGYGYVSLFNKKSFALNSKFEGTLYNWTMDKKKELL